MVPVLKVLLFLTLHLLQDVKSSKVHLNNNGYEGVVIAINPSVPEDERLIPSLKEMVTQASTYLFEATGRRFYFRNVSILVPITWKSKTEYLTPKQESYDQADVIVADPHLKYGDDPYTLQYGQCGDRGRYIHFTPNFLLIDNLSIYGPRGRVFVHEWAHLRWGVFDEYNEDQPFYSASSKKIEATRCSTGIKGMNRVHVCQGGSCITRRCRRNSTTQLYEKDCQFFPDKVQTEKSSIMFMQSIDSVTEFCKKENHNREAPTLHNQKCDYRSTWEVISNSEDFKNSTPMEMPPSPPFFSLLRISERIVCLVLDVSGSMGSYDRLNRMNQAAKFFLQQIVESRSWVGMVHFESTATVKSELIQMNSDVERNQLLETLPTRAGGGTSICSGIRTAFQVFKNGGFQTDGTEILLLSDGEDNTANSCIDEVKNSGAILHFIALGPSADISVTEMATITGGKHLLASDLAQNNGLIDAFGALASENADVTQKSLQLESKGSMLTNSRWLNDTVVTDSTVGKDTYFLVTWSKQVPTIHLRDPKGTQITNFTIDIASKMAYLTIPGIAEVGVWTYNLEAKVDSEILTITVTSQASRPSVPPIIVNAKVNTDTNSYPSPMIVYAEVLQGYTPITGARVTATIESNSGKTEELILLDNGAGADAFKDDGVYSRYFTAYSDNGRYSVKVRADGGTNSARRSSRHPSSRAAYIPGWVVDGEIQGNPPRPETTEDTQPVLENFSRTASGGAFVMSKVPALPLPDQYPPNQITDLQATLDGEKISLTWTAPGDDFDVGRVQQYIIRTSENIIDLRDNFNKSLQVNTTHLIPKEANSKETFAFKPETISGENATYIFIAIESVDKSNLHSGLSNIAQVALFTPQADPVPEESPQSGVSITTIVLSVVGAVVLVCIIVSTTVCILKRKRSSSGPATTF